MTTMVRVLNEGPSKIRVSSIKSETGEPDANGYAPLVLAPGELTRMNAQYVYGGRSLRIDEVKGEPVESK